MPKGNPFGYAAKKMKKGVRGTAGGNKGKKFSAKRIKPTQKNKYYG